MDNIERIASFTVDHDLITEGIYLSRIDGDIATYDMRTRRPNMGDYMDNVTMHSVEHMFATYVRNSDIGDKVIYFGPMGCRTGFYFLVRDGISHSEAIKIVFDSMKFIKDYEGEIPGVSRKECGNYLEHDLASAKEIAADMVLVLENWKEENLMYTE